MTSQMNQTRCKTLTLLQACSNHGACDESIGKCICENGWTSIGDFATQPGIHCSINLITVRVLWIIAVVTLLPLFYSSLKFLISKYNNKNNNLGKKKNKNKKSGHAFLSSPPVFSVTCLFLASICGIVMCILKIIDQESYSMGLHPITTLAMSMSIIFYVAGMSTYVTILINFILGYAKVMSPKSRESIVIQTERVKKAIFLMKISLPFIFFPSVMSLMNPNLEYASLFALFACCIAVTIFLAIHAVRYLGVIIFELKLYLEDIGENQNTEADRYDRDMFAQLKMKFERARVLVVVASLQTTIFYGLFLFIDTLSYNVAYLMPFMTPVTSTLSIVLVMSLVNETRDSSLSDARSNSKDDEAKVASSYDATRASKLTSEKIHSNQHKVNSSEGEQIISSVGRVMPGDVEKE